MALMWGSLSLPMEPTIASKCGSLRALWGLSSESVYVSGGYGFPSFLPKEIQNIKDPYARTLARRIERLPVQLQIGCFNTCIMSSCVKPLNQSETNPVVLLHSFDSSCLEWRGALPLLEEDGLETWALDVLGWGFSDLERLPPCNVASKRCHLYQLWRSYIKRPMILVGPSLGAAIAIDFAVNHPEAVKKLILISPSVYSEGTGNLAKIPKMFAYAGVGRFIEAPPWFSFTTRIVLMGLSNQVSLLMSLPLRFYANILTFNSICLATSLDWTNVGRLHCLLPWWKDATINFMASGGYNVIAQIQQVKQNALVIYGEHDQLVSYKEAMRLHFELSNSIFRLIPDCGHLPHTEKPYSVVKLIANFAKDVCC